MTRAGAARPRAVPWLLALATAACASSRAPVQVSLRMVERFDLGAHLVQQGMVIAQRTQTYGMIASEVGAESASRLVEEELARSASSRRAEWDLILARSYLDHFSPDELESITRDGKSSPFAAKLSAEHRNVEKSVNARGSEFFTAYVAEALSRAFQRSVAGRPSQAPE